MIHTPVMKRVEQALRSIGYQSNLLASNYEYADVTSDDYVVRKIAIAGFAQTPPSYRNSCIGVIAANGLAGLANVKQHRALGAPMIFEVNNTTVDRWKITRNSDPELIEKIKHADIERKFSAHQQEWNPQAVFRAKSISLDIVPVQLDFIDVGLIPALEGMVHRKLDTLLRNTLAKIDRAYQRHSHSKPPYEDLFRLVFRLIAAKVFRDRRFPGNWESGDAAKVLNAVEAHYNTSYQNVFSDFPFKQEILDLAWESISSAFHFQNLSVDDLAFIYENTFITKDARKTFGTHSTPPRLAEYIVNKLPFEDLPEARRHVLEPCSGHGIFLVAAMRRLRDLLTTSLSNTRRHKYFVERLVGIEIDSFAAEVCRLSLMLADYPNPDGWQIYNEDIYITPKLSEELRRADIVLCNPPFKDFTSAERKRYSNDILVQKPAELLRRVLNRPPSLLGFVLPLVFNTGNSYRDFHRLLAATYSKIELVSLPEVFNYSDVPTVLLLAAEKREQNRLTAITCRTFNDQSLEIFFNQGKEPLAITETRQLPEKEEASFSLWIPQLSRVWRYLEDYPKLLQEADIHLGLHWKGRSTEYKRGERRTDVISDTEKRGFVRGIARVENNLLQYYIQGTQYLSLNPEDQHDNAYKLPWHKPKVVCNRGRLQRSAWRLGAVADPLGLAFSQQFLALWPIKATLSIYALSSVLNSPVANAWCHTKDLQIDNRIQTLRALPIPSPEYLGEEQEIAILSRELHRRLQKRQGRRPSTDDFALRQLLLQIDATILKAYDLPPVLERELLDLFQGISRPVPFEFNGYYPPDFTAYLPLHEIISEEFKEARATRLLERLEPVYDSKISEMVTWLAGA